MSQPRALTLVNEISTHGGVPAHWGIENCMHWVLDVAFREDDCRIRVGEAAQNFAILRRIALIY